MVTTVKPISRKTHEPTRHTYRLTVESHPTIRGCLLAKLVNETKTAPGNSGVYPVEILLWAAEELKKCKKPFRGP